MSIRVEFYGIPRRRADCEFTQVEAQGGALTFGELLDELRNRFPQLAAECINGDRLKPGFTANIDGQRFIRDADAIIRNHQSVLILSTDAGG